MMELFCPLNENMHSAAITQENTSSVKWLLENKNIWKNLKINVLKIIKSIWFDFFLLLPAFFHKLHSSISPLSLCPFRWTLLACYCLTWILLINSLNLWRNSPAGLKLQGRKKLQTSAHKYSASAQARLLSPGDEIHFKNLLFL